LHLCDGMTSHKCVTMNLHSFYLVLIKKSRVNWIDAHANLGYLRNITITFNLKIPLQFCIHFIDVFISI
jgi:hypothetical protein